MQPPVFPQYTTQLPAATVATTAKSTIANPMVVIPRRVNMNLRTVGRAEQQDRDIMRMIEMESNNRAQSRMPSSATSPSLASPPSPPSASFMGDALLTVQRPVSKRKPRVAQRQLKPGRSYDAAALSYLQNSPLDTRCGVHIHRERDFEMVKRHSISSAAKPTGWFPTDRPRYTKSLREFRPPKDVPLIVID